MKKTIAIFLIIIFLIANNPIVYAISEITDNFNDSKVQEEANMEEQVKENNENNENNESNENNTNTVETESEEQTENSSVEAISSKEQIMTVSNSEERIPNGVYRISIADPSYCHMAIEIKDGSKQAQANVQIGEWFNINNEKNKFQITYEGDDYYSIGLANTNNMFDVQDGGMNPGNNVWQYEDNKTDAQRWKIVKNNDGSYSFISKKNNLYLTVTNGNMSEGANLEVNKRTNTVGQNFKLINLNDKPKEEKINGICTINLDSNLALEIENSSTENGGNLRVGKLLEKTSNIQKRFEFTYEDDGYYTIRSVNSGKVLEAQGGGTKSGTNVSQFVENYTDSQRWKIVKNDDETYSIINKKSEIANDEKNKMYLDIQDGTLTQNTNVQVNSKIDGNRQKFKITKVAEEKQLITNGTYRISLNEPEYSHMSLEIKDGSKQSQANVQIGEWHNINNEKNKFQITYVGDGYYTINLKNTKNFLDVYNGDMTPGTNIWQYTGNDSDAQKWRAIINDDGSYSFISKKNNLYLTGQGITVSEGGNVEVDNRTNKIGQNFKLINLDNKPSRTLNDGTYKISTTTNSQLVVGITGAGTLGDSGAMAKITDWTEIANGEKKFDLKYEDDGYYTIKSVYSGKVLEVQNGGMKNNTLIWQFDENYTDSQRWKITKNSDNTYTLQNKKSDLYLSIENNDVKAGKNLVLYEKNSSKLQNFKITTVERNEGVKLEEGTYKIVPFSNPDVSIDIENASREISANVQLGITTNEIRNEFNIVPDGNGYYIIKSVNSGNVLDSKNGEIDQGTDVWQYAENGTDAQKWIIKQNTDGTYSIICKKSGLYLDVYNGNSSNGNNIWLYTGNDTPAQKFYLKKQSKKTEKYIDEGLYKFEAKPNRSIAFDIEEANKDDGGIVQIWSYTGVHQQQFLVYYENSNGYYYIQNLNSNKVIATDGQNVKQYTKDLNKENQKWILKKQSDGYYSFVSKEGKLAITIPNGKVENGTNLVMQELTNSENQLFMIENAGIYIDENKYPGIKDKIDKLTVGHPNWNFELLYTGINFDDATYAEYITKDRCLVDTRTYQGGWISSTAKWSGVWASASRAGVNYFMDARNFLNETDVFQFLDANSYVEDSVSLEGIQSQVNGSFLRNYANDVNNACKKQNVNPYFVLARLFQEQGKEGSSIGTGMPGGDGKTYYNPYNIGAQVGNDYATALQKAKEEGWDTMEKALIGGIDFLKTKWLSIHQNTLYQNKFDIDLRSGSSLYTHQYMQNLSAAYSEGHTLRSCYVSSGKLDSSFTFVIPIYENMPQDACARPAGNTSSSSNTQSVDRGPKDATVVVGSTLNLRESASTSSTSLKKLSNGTHLISIKRAVNGNWHQVVTDDGTIGYVSGDYLQIVNDVIKCNVKKITTSNVYARIGPSTSTDSLYLVSAGTSVTVINAGAYNIGGYTWDRVILPDGAQAFIANKYLG